MKIECTCGHLIVDTSDYLPHKGHLYPDKLWYPLWDKIDDAIKNGGSSLKEFESACMKLRHFDKSRHTWQCLECGNLYIDDENGKLNCYIPVDNASKTILDYTEQGDRE
jgi:hypothetical protein